MKKRCQTPGPRISRFFSRTWAPVPCRGSRRWDPPWGPPAGGTPGAARQVPGRPRCRERGVPRGRCARQARSGAAPRGRCATGAVPGRSGERGAPGRSRRGERGVPGRGVPVCRRGRQPGAGAAWAIPGDPGGPGGAGAGRCGRVRARWGGPWGVRRGKSRERQAMSQRAVTGFAPAHAGIREGRGRGRGAPRTPFRALIRKPPFLRAVFIKNYAKTTPKRPANYPSCYLDFCAPRSD